MTCLILLMLAQEPGAAGEEIDLLAHATEVPQLEPATSASPLVVYGILRCDAILESARTDYPYAPSLARNPNSYEEEPSFRMGAQDSRLGFVWRSAADPNLTAQAEWDVRSPQASASQIEYSYIRLNRGFFQYRGDTWAVRAGQDTDLFGARSPGVLNYEYFRWAGNIGYRRPLVRFDLATGEGRKISVALVGPIGVDWTVPSWYDTGTDAALPDVQASFTQQMGAVEWGVSGVLGARRDPIADEDYSLVGVCGDARIDLGKLGVMEGPWIVSAELWMGTNLASYMGGVGHGVYAGEEVPVIGGWLSMQIPVRDDVVLRVGYGFDDPNENEMPDDYLPIGRNQVIWIGAYWTLTEQITVGAEANLFFTDYLDDPLTGFDESANAKATSIRFVGAARF